ncbi:MAG: twin-arginine translocation signal domain-containing protein, partial [Mariniphaga sp.]|nr:twin-arginine translocation signal domain-containing protein [Mariniphaga sp.]
MGTKRLNASRREFLKKSAALTGTILATSALKPFTAIIFAANQPDETKPWYGVGIDIEKCIGCGMCA